MKLGVGGVLTHIVINPSQTIAVAVWVPLTAK